MTQFTKIPFKTKTISEKSQSGYKVYTDKEKFQIVEATTVAEALEKSGIKDPFKIEIAGVITRSLFSQSEVAEKQAPKPAQPEAPAPQPEAKAPEQAPPA